MTREESARFCFVSELHQLALHLERWNEVDSGYWFPEFRTELIPPKERNALAEANSRGCSYYICVAMDYGEAAIQTDAVRNARKLLVLIDADLSYESDAATLRKIFRVAFERHWTALRSVIAELSVEEIPKDAPNQQSIDFGTTATQAAEKPKDLSAAVTKLKGVGPDPFIHFYNEVKKRSATFSPRDLELGPSLQNKFSTDTRTAALKQMVDFGWLNDDGQPTKARTYTKTPNLPQ